MPFFKQCKLIRRNGRPNDVLKDDITGQPHSGVVGVYTAWLPEEFAKVGKVVDLQRGDGTWTTGWVVEEVYTRMSEEYVRAHEDDHKHQHKASDKLTPNKGLGLEKKK